MGTRVHSAVIYGVKFTVKETKAFESFMKDKPPEWFLMRYAEQAMVEDWKKRKIPYNKRSVYTDNLFLHYLYKIDRRKKTAAHPYRPFWTGVSKKELERIEHDLWGRASDYLKKKSWNSEAQGAFKLKMFWPESHSDCDPNNMFGYVQESRYASEIDYALLDILKIGTNSKTYTIPGKRPWECGTAYDKKRKTFYTLNGQNMLPEKYYPKDKREEIISKILWRKGVQNYYQYVEEKEEIWNEYHKDRKPYKNYPCEGWNGSDFYFYPVDRIYQLICKYIPTIKYDVMRLDKFLCFYWG
jgi:hypothetical protein